MFAAPFLKPAFVVKAGVCLALISWGVWFYIQQQSFKTAPPPKHLQLQNKWHKNSFHLSFYNLKGEELSLAQFRGRFVLLNFWATWCAPCVAELPSLVQMADFFSKHLTVIAVSDESPKDIKDFLKAFKKWPAYVIPARAGRNTIRQTLQIKAFPETYIINPQGRLIEKIIGPQKWNSKKWQTYIKQLIKQSLAASMASKA